MLNKNKLSQYLIYAIGEIILVVIGILIAIQINNRNELSKKNKRQNSYLLLIKSEMENNLHALEKERETLTKAIISQQEILRLIHDKYTQDTISENQLSKTFIDAISNDISVNHENSVLTELIVSGNLKDIENKKIRSELSSWESKIYKIREQENSLSNYWSKINVFFESNGNYRTLFDQTTYSNYIGLQKLPINESNKEVLNSVIFENILLIKLASSVYLERDVYPKYQNELVELIKLIDAETNRK